jgi:hypothetical protein
MLELLHRWVRSYEAVAVRGSAQTQTQGQEELPPSLLPDSEIAAAAHWGKDTWDGVRQARDAGRQISSHIRLTNGEVAELIVAPQNWPGSVGSSVANMRLSRAPSSPPVALEQGESQGGRTRTKGGKDSSAINEMEECEGEDEAGRGRVRSSTLSSQPPFLLRNNSANSMSSMRSFSGSRAIQEEGECDASLVCNSSLSSEPPPFLQRNSSISSMRSFASQSSLSSDYGGETNSFGRLLDVETELPMIMA